MFKIQYSPNLSGEITVPASKNAALPIVAANYCIDQQIKLKNIPQIIDVQNMQILAEEALQNSHEYFNLSSDLATQFRASILLIPLGLHKFGKVKFVSPGGCKIGKRPLDTFDNALIQAGVSIHFDDEGHKIFQKVSKPKKNIMMQEFSVTAIEALLIYLAFLPDIDYSITIRQTATEPHVKNLIDFLKQAGAQINMGIDHTITITPQTQINIQSDTPFKIISDYIQAGTYFAIGAGADNSEITIKDINIDDLSAMYNIAEKIGIHFKIIDKHTITVNSKNKPNYQALNKLETRIFPGFPTDLQSIFGTLLTQCHGISKIFETMFEGRFSYLTELENLGAKIEILNPHQAIIIGPNKLRGTYVSSNDLRGGGAMILAGIMAEGETFITQEEIILRGYEDIIHKLQNIGVHIERTS